MFGKRLSCCCETHSPSSGDSAADSWGVSMKGLQLPSLTPAHNLTYFWNNFIEIGLKLTDTQTHRDSNWATVLPLTRFHMLQAEKEKRERGTERESECERERERERFNTPLLNLCLTFSLNYISTDLVQRGMTPPQVLLPQPRKEVKPSPVTQHT